MKTKMEWKNENEWVGRKKNTVSQWMNGMRTSKSDHNLLLQHKITDGQIVMLNSMSGHRVPFGSPTKSEMINHFTFIICQIKYHLRLSLETLMKNLSADLYNKLSPGKIDRFKAGWIQNAVFYLRDVCIPAYPSPRRSMVKSFALHKVRKNQDLGLLLDLNMIVYNSFWNISTRYLP